MKNITKLALTGALILGLNGCKDSFKEDIYTRKGFSQQVKARDLCREMVLAKNGFWFDEEKKIPTTETGNYNEWCNRGAENYKNFVDIFMHQYCHLDSNKRFFLEKAENIVLESGYSKEEFREDLRKEIYKMAISFREGKNIEVSNKLLGIGDSLNESNLGR